jgi:hypothetical protein
MGLPFIGDLIDGVKDIVSEVVVDKDKRDQVNLELKKLEDQATARLDAQVSSQIEVNKVEAASNSVFVAGWRPAVGWVGAAGLAYATIFQPLASWTAAVVFEYKGGFPILDTELLWVALSGILGIGGMRSFEKYKGVATDNYAVQPPIAGANQTTVDVTKEGEVNVATNTTPISPTPIATPVVQKKKKKFKIF